MHNIDLIIYPILDFKLYHKFPFPTYRWNPYWFPVWYYKEDLKKMGVNIRFLNPFNLKYKTLSKTVGIDSKAIPYLFRNFRNFQNIKKKLRLSFVKKLKKRVNNLLWFDNTDSTGSTSFELLPYVDRYFKKQLLKDRSLYTKKFYRNRIYTDFYARNYNFDKKNEDLTEVPLNLDYLQKIALSWNLALCDYRYSNDLARFFFGFSKKMNLNYHKPNLNRKFIFSANYNVKFNSEMVAFQRKFLLKLLTDNYNFNKNVSIGYIRKKDYIENAGLSKAIFSPFGYGEVCLRDFEAFIAGAALIKPNMNHLETWPGLYKEQKTYIPLPWKVENWKNIITEILADENFLFGIAKNGQESYKKIWTKEGKEEFCKRFIKMVIKN